MRAVLSFILTGNRHERLPACCTNDVTMFQDFKISGFKIFRSIPLHVYELYIFVDNVRPDNLETRNLEILKPNGNQKS